MGFVVQTAVVIAFLAYFPWFGNASDEFKLIGPLLGGVAVSLAIAWVWGLLTAPAKIDKIQSAFIRERQIAMDEAKDFDWVSEKASDFWKVGRHIYDGMFNQVEGIDSPKRADQLAQTWSDRVKQFLEIYCDAPTLHRFEKENQLNSTPVERLPRQLELVDDLAQSMFGYRGAHPTYYVEEPIGLPADVMDRILDDEKMVTLRNARDEKLEEFIKEHEADPDGDLDKLDSVIKRPTQETAKAIPKASTPAPSDD